jgi:hypothetical protein
MPFLCSKLHPGSRNVVSYFLVTSQRGLWFSFSSANIKTFMIDPGAARLSMNSSRLRHLALSSHLAFNSKVR